MQMAGPLENGLVIAGYRVDELISRGGFGFVYRVTHVALGRIYALKVLAPELAEDEQFRERFRREIRIAASLHHPHVVAIHYAGEHQGLLFLVMDLISGTDLHQVLRSSGAFDPERATAVLTQLASALDAAHAKGLVHRDVKPANILLAVRDGEDHAYLTDFGTAKKFDSVTGVEGLTKKGVVIGTVDYMAPEQITGRQADARTDIYALGCVFFQMLTGRAPYQRENSVATLYAHVHEPVPALTGAVAQLHPAFAAVVEKAMAKEPDDRYPSAGDFARDAVAALHSFRNIAPPTVVTSGQAGTESAERVPVAGPPGSFVEPIPRPEATDAPLHATARDAQSATPAAASVPTRADWGAEQEAAAASQGRFQERTRKQPSPPGDVPPLPPERPGPNRRGTHYFRWAALAAVVVVAGAVAAIIALTSKGSSAAPTFAATLRPVPTNRVTGTGTATVALRGNTATVTVDTNGLLNAVHLMHIHGGTGKCPTASAAQVINGQRFISGNAASPIYGGVVASLTRTGDDTSPGVHLVSSLYSVGANIHYSRTLTLAPGVAGELREGLAVIVVHGIDYNGNGRYDNSLGPQAEAQAPALCGPLEPAKTASAMGSDKVKVVYTASLRLDEAFATGRSASLQLPGRSASLQLLCHPLVSATGASTAAQSRARLPT